MNRVFVRNVNGSRADISREELHHLVSVLRTKPGDIFEGVTGGDFRYRCRLDEDNDGYYGEVIGEIGHNDESPLKLELAAALIKREKFELILQKATELGVNRIVPLNTARTEIRLDSRREEKKMERWKRIISEAVKQCGRNKVPILEHSMDLEAYLGSTGERKCFVLDEDCSEPVRKVLRALAGNDSLSVMIGPEGGWADEERLLMKRFSNLARAGLGPRVLRAETASVAALAVIQYELGDL